MRTVVPRQLALSESNAVGAIAADPIVVDRIAALDWQRAAASLDVEGHAVMHSMLSPEECASLAEGYAVDEQFRSRIMMARHGFGTQVTGLRENQWSGGNAGRNGCRFVIQVLTESYVLRPESCHYLSPASAGMTPAIISLRDAGVSRLIRPSVPLR